MFVISNLSLSCVFGFAEKLVAAGNDQIIDIERHKDHVLLISRDVNTVIGLAFLESDLDYKLVDSLVPHPR